MYYIMAFIKQEYFQRTKLTQKIGVALGGDYCLEKEFLFRIFLKNNETLHYCFTDFKNAKS